MTVGRPSKLTPEVLEKVKQLADLGLPAALIHDRIGIGSSTWDRWMQRAKKAEPDTIEGQFRAVINNAASKLAERYLSSLHGQADQGNVNAITWLLTHHPKLRDQFSDAAAERRTERRVMTGVLDAVLSANLPQEQQDLLLLQLQARGLGVEPPPGPEHEVL